MYYRLMRVIFLDFDGVLNSSASFIMEKRRRKKDKRITSSVSETLCHVCSSNFQYILDQCPDVKIVITSTWRIQHKISWLRKKMKQYGIDGSRVIDTTHATFSGWRGREITMWLDDNPQVKEYVVIDDNSLIVETHNHRFVKTSWPVGLTLPHAREAIRMFGVKLDEDEE